MATVQVVGSPADFDVDGFAAFLAAQPDLGTKATPTLLRVTADLPVTATRKVDKPALKRLQWRGTDPVFELREGRYRPLTAERAADLREEFARHGRLAFLHDAPER